MATKVHFIGILGVSMRSLAELTQKLGFNVSGSDREDIPHNYFEERNINAYKGANLANIDAVDIIVYSSSIPECDLELNYARKKQKFCFERSEYINIISKLCKKTIFVSGSHGKSTTTNIIAQVLEKEKYGLIGHIGANIVNRENGLIFTGFNAFVSEACEYKKNFLNFNPDIGIILNIDYDHPDTYKSIDDVKDAFIKFAKNIKSTLIVHESVATYFKNLPIKLITFGENLLSTYTYKIISENKEYITMCIYKDLQYVTTIKLKSLLRENCLNYLAAYIALVELLDNNLVKGIMFDNIDAIRRRAEKLGKVNCTEVIIDYAHHPKEIECSYNGLKKFYNHILVIFEAHTYSRTQYLYDEFKRVLKDINNLVILPSFAAREKAEIDPIINLACNLNNATFIKDKSSAVEYLKLNYKKYDLILILGAGNAYKIGYRFMDEMVNNERLS